MRARVLFVASLIALAAVGCGDKKKSGSTDGGAPGQDSGVDLDSGTTPVVDSGNSTDDEDAGNGSSDAGSTPVDAGPLDAGGGDDTAPAVGQSIANATFSDADGDYNGLVTDYVGDVTKGTTSINGDSYYFETHDATFRSLSVRIDGVPVKGKTYELTNDNIFTVGAIFYAEAANIDSVKQYKCLGDVTVDSVEGSTYGFSFSATCEPNAQMAMGTVKIEGDGIGSF